MALHLRQNKTCDPPHSYHSFAYMYTPIHYNRQLYDPSLTTTSFLFTIIYMYHYQQHLSMVDFQPRAEMKRMFQNYIVPQKFVTDNVDHLA